MTSLIRIAGLLLVLFCVAPLGARAESARWIIEPVYNSVSRYEDFFKVKLGSHVGIIDKDGNEVVPVTADSITDPADGYSLVLRVEDDKYRLAGILHAASGKLTPITSDWYVGDYAFYSEGLLPVYNKKGIYGYIDTEGKENVPFEYAAVHPFCNGLAAVSKTNAIKGLVKKLKIKTKSSMIYIQPKGVPFNMPSEVGDVTLATSFKYGEALVENTEGKRFYIDNSGRVTRTESSSRILTFDKKYALTDGTEQKDGARTSQIKFNGPTTFSKNGLYGYLYNGKVVLPAQFVQARGFSDGYAIAKANTGVGVLQLTSGSVECAVADKGGNSSEISATATIPFEASSTTFELECVGSNGVTTRGQGEQNGQTWRFALTKADSKCEYRLLMKGPHSDLAIWSSNMELSEEKPASATDNTQKKSQRTKTRKEKKDKKKEGVWF